MALFHGVGTHTTRWRDLKGSCFNSVVRVVVKSGWSFIIVIAVIVFVVLLSCRFVVCALMSRKDTISIFGQLDRTPPDVRTQDRFSINIAIKEEQRKHNVDHNDDDIDYYDGADALHAVVNEERVKVYDPA